MFFNGEEHCAFAEGRKDFSFNVRKYRLTTGVRKLLGGLLLLLICLVGCPAVRVEAAQTSYDVSSDADLKKAADEINAAEAGSYTINITNSFTVPSGIGFSGTGKKVTIQGNGYTISDPENTDTTAVIMVFDGTEVSLYNITITGNNTDSSSNQTLVEVTGRSSVLNLCEGTVLKDNYCSGQGGAVDIDSGTVNMYAGSRIENCRANICGGGVNIDGNVYAIFNMYGGTIHGCKYVGGLSDSSGGGINMIKADGITGNLHITGGIIENCTTNGYYGGGLWARGENVSISGLTVKDCSVINYGYYGGGIALQGCTNLNLSNVTVIGNTAPYGGGGILLNGCNGMTLTGITVSGNSGAYGGGMALFNCSNVAASNITVTGNTGSRGGGFYIQGSDLDLSSSGNIICNNRTTDETTNRYASDVLVYSGSVILPDAEGMNRNFRDSGIRINGWFDDGWDEYEGDIYKRYTLTEPTNEYSSGVSLSSKGLVAAVKPGLDYTLVYDAGTTDTVLGMPDPITVTQRSSSGSSSFMLSSAAPERAGYTFKGWADTSGATEVTHEAGSSLVITGTADAERTKTLYAVWEEEAKNSYTLTYDANGGTGAPAEETKKGKTSADFSVSFTVPTWDGHTFLGWADDSSATSSTYTVGSKITISGDNGGSKTIYAVWAANDADVFTLNYSANGGEGAPGSQSGTSVDGSATLTVSNVTPTREGYRFLGWADSADASTVAYTANGTITLTKSNTESNEKTIYAVWISEEDAKKKEGVPQIEKKVWNKNNSAWQDAAYAEVNRLSGEDQINFKITGTMPSNLEDTIKTKNEESGEEMDTGTPVYSSYTDYKFTDTYDAGITLNPESIRVYLFTSAPGSMDMTGGTDITSLFDIDTGTSGTFTVNLKKSGVTAEGEGEAAGAVDLKKSYAVKGQTVSFTKDSLIVVYYTGRLNSSATTGLTGNMNKAHLEFRNANGEYLYTPDDIVKVFTFTLDVTKYKDSVAEGNGFAGVSFNLYKDSKDNSNLIGSGTSGENGKVSIPGLTTISAGTYILEETNTPAGYNRIGDIIFTITPEVTEPSDDPQLTYDLSVSGEDGSTLISASADNTAIIVDVVNKAGSLLPNTGGIGTTAFYFAGGGLILAAVILLIVRRKRRA